MNYEKIYTSIISNAQSRDKLDGYTERHHIIPKSLGGSDDNNNIIDLTAREHFLAHYCLWKFTTGEAQYKMAHAFSFMRAGMSKYRYINSRLYSSLRCNLKHTSKTKQKISINNVGMLGKNHTEETKQKLRGIVPWNKGKKGISEEARINLSNSLKNKPWSAKRRAAHNKGN